MTSGRKAEWHGNGFWGPGDRKVGFLGDKKGYSQRPSVLPPTENLDRKPEDFEVEMGVVRKKDGSRGTVIALDKIGEKDCVEIIFPDGIKSKISITQFDNVFEMVDRKSQ